MNDLSPSIPALVAVSHIKRIVGGIKAHRLTEQALPDERSFFVERAIDELHELGGNGVQDHRRGAGSDRVCHLGLEFVRGAAWPVVHEQRGLAVKQRGLVPLDREEHAQASSGAAEEGDRDELEGCVHRWMVPLPVGSMW